MGADFTPYPDVNDALRHFLGHIRAILGDAFVGMYVYGSLAQGDFDHDTSDIDFIVVTDRAVADEQFALLGDLHADFRASDSYWAEKIEAAYIQREALNWPAADSPRYPQLEKGRDLLWEPLENGWPFQRNVLREQGLVVAGPAPAALMTPVPAQELAEADLVIVRLWQKQRHSDPTWLPWVRERQAQRFFLVTLCRALYRHEQGTLASKAAAAAWAQATLEPQWSALIARAFAARDDHANVSDEELSETLAFLDYTAQRLS
jgi:hypothetical protein